MQRWPEKFIHVIPAGTHGCKLDFTPGGVMNKAVQTLYQGQAKIEELESIRGMAALLVVFYHIPNWNPLFDIGIVRSGYLMVHLFFVLSGFVIYNAYAARIGSAQDLMRFQFLRFGRLYPVHLLFLLVYVLFEVAKYVGQARLGIVSPNSQPFRENSLTALVQQIFLVQAIGPAGHPTSFNTPAWSISVEFYTYLIFGAIVLCLPRIKNLLFSLLAMASLLMLVTNATFGFGDLLKCLAGFFIGCLTAFTVQRLPLAFPRALSLILFAAIVAFLHWKTSERYDAVIYLLSALLIASVVAVKDGYLNRLLNLKALTWLGAVSYAVYMSHVAVIWVLSQVMRVVLKKPEAMIGERSTPQLSVVEVIIAWGLLIAIVLVISALVQRFVETPLRARSRRLAERWWRAEIHPASRQVT
ncbi:peptidoglycan/LPS O-acetylase OafA/YrhL [Herbaspirillum sp. 1173]|uniref:acyltransferase family protein n=1 Tax=Herbaspirillum sp. 1173 TaxID=2817734 RepID=UPI002859D608|nr:acyltransferase [Herbaspirillum sp. 1173]MDR6738168.1 peptidoglycan/LPS O-acetylase OafA/YrhL [Herbaspirillum sp. 1173]